MLLKESFILEILGFHLGIIISNNEHTLSKTVCLTLSSIHHLIWQTQNGQHGACHEITQDIIQGVQQVCPKCS